MSTKTVAIVVGGAGRVLDDWVVASNMCAAAGVEIEVIVVNDMIERFNHHNPVVAVTLHPDKLTDWINKRANNRYPRPSEVWSMRTHPLVTRRLGDLGGSVGLFAFLVARHKGHGKIILCGVPMTKEAGHFVRGKPWRDVTQFIRAWEQNLDKIALYTRSLSGGWTQEVLGPPTIEWLLR